MVTIGNTNLPGVQLTVQSSRSVGASSRSPGQIGIVGQADLTSGTTDANDIESVTSIPAGNARFGDSPLATAVGDALAEGAFPVFAVAAGPSEESESVSSASGTLENAPISEDPEDTLFTVGDTDLETTITLEDPSNKSPQETEAIVNPTTGAYSLGVSGEGSVDYVSLDYVGAIDALVDEEGDRLDFIGGLTENIDVVDHLYAIAKEMEEEGKFLVAQAGAASRISDFEGYENPFDSSRIQLHYPSRNSGGESLIGSYLGLRARLGMNASPMRKRLATQTRLAHSLSRTEMELLSDQRVNPIKSERSGALVMDDVTCVSLENVDELEFSQGISRIVTDYVSEIVDEHSDSYIGELHSVSSRNALSGTIKSELKDLLSLNAITGYTVQIEEINAMEARVDVGIETIKPLRNIRAVVTAGQVN